MDDLFLSASSHQQDEQTTCDYKSSTEQDSVIRNLLEENKGNDLGDNEEDRDINPHQAIEIEAAFVNQETIREQGQPAGNYEISCPFQSHPDQGIPSNFEKRRKYENDEGL